jgi:membrane-bound lytic murein transglycosylase B
MEALGQVPQRSTTKRNAMFATGLAAGTASVTGYLAHSEAKTAIASATKRLDDAKALKIDEGAIRDRLGRLYYKGKSVPPESQKTFDSFVQSEVKTQTIINDYILSSAQKNYEKTQKLYKGAGRNAAVASAVVVGAGLGVVAFAKNIFKSIIEK